MKKFVLIALTAACLFVVSNSFSASPLVPESSGGSDVFAGDNMAGLKSTSGDEKVEPWPQIDWPGYYVENGETITVEIRLRNYNLLTTEYTVAGVMTSPTEGWLDVKDTTYVVEPEQYFSFDVGITAPLDGPMFVEGEIIVCEITPPADTFCMPISIHVWTSPGPIEEPGIYDTVASSSQWDGKGLDQYVGLVASNHGEQGHEGWGEVNLDFVKGGVDCDDNATVYLYSGSPFVMIKRPEGVSITSSHYSTNVGSGFCWVPLPGYPMSEGLEVADGYEYDTLYTGRMVNRDTTMWMERTYFSPRSYAEIHNFVAVRTVVGAYATILDSIAIGEITDWDVPSDALGNIGSPNVANIGFVQGNPFLFIKGYSDTVGCTVNEQRFATNVFVGKHYSNQTAYSATYDYWGASAVNVRQFLDFDTLTNEPPTWLWDSLYVRNGIVGSPDIIDQGEILTYGFYNGLNINTELVFWTVYVTGYEAADQEAVESEVATALHWVRRVSESQCCEGLRGDIDFDGGIQPSIGDLTALISKMFINLNQSICYEEANLDGSQPEGPGSISLGDLVVLIDIMFISLSDPPACP